MPYPFDPPKAKHDLLCPASFSSAKASSLADTFGFASSGDLFAALAQPVPSNLPTLATVYSYPDAPKTPLSRGLLVIGVADMSLSVVRKLVHTDDDDDDTDHSHRLVHACTIAVKRADGALANKLPPKDVHNSHKFAQFIRKIHHEGLVAILANDKHGRFGILQPTEDQSKEYTQHNDNDTDNTTIWEGQDFAARIWVGETQRVKEYLQQGMQPRPETPPLPPPPEESTTTEAIWKPSNHGTQNDHDTAAVDTETSTGLWKPPGATIGGGGGDTNINDNENGGSAGLWKSVTGNDGDDTGSSLWKPSTDNDGQDGATSSNDGGGGEEGFSWKPSTDGNTNETTADAEPTFGYNGSSNTNAWNANNDNDSTNVNGNRIGDSTKDGADGDETRTGKGFHADSGAAAADAFYSNLTRTLDSRANSRIYHMRAFNGWVKATQIQELDPKTKQAGKKVGREPMRVLDLACGKGGDLGKWVLHSRGISNYVGIDVARGSLKDAAIRARQMRQKLARCTFTCADLGADVPGRLKSSKHKHMQKLLTWSLQSEPRGATTDPEFRNMRGGGVSLEDRFDVVSIQFAIHYMMQTKSRARRFFRTVSELLEVGGNLIATTIDARVVISHMMNLGIDLHFNNDTDMSKHPGALISTGGGACKLRFEPEMVKKLFHSDKDDDEALYGIEYSFSLVEGSDHAAGVGDAVNLPEWLIPIPVLKSLGEEVGLELEYAQNFHEFFEKRKDPKVYGAAHNSIYSMKVLNRHGSLSQHEWEISRMYCAIKFRKVKEPSIPFEDDEADAEDEEDDEIDPKIKAKLLPMAMMKAKKEVGADVWKSLPSDEKTRLTDVEVRKLMKK